MRTSRTSFGNFFPTHSAAAKLAVALVVGSLLAGLLRGSAFPVAVILTPELVLSRFWIWQPFTYAFIELQPMGVIFGALIIWSLGGALEATWGARRMMLFGVGVTALAGVLSVLLALVIPSLRVMSWTGGTVLGSALWVAYGWAYGSRQTNFWGLPVTGNVFAGLGILFVVLTAVMQDWSLVVPSGFAVLLTYLYVRYGSPVRLWEKFRNSWDRSRLRARSRHLKDVSKDRNIAGGSDRFLH